MRRLAGVVVCACSTAFMAGCSTVNNFEQKAAFSVGATELNMQTIDGGWSKRIDFLTKANIGVTPDKKLYLGYVADQSELQCRQFIAGLAVAANGTHSGLDMLTTVFSALGTAFTPLSTVHVLTAGATITSGWKSAIDSDVYSKMGVQNIVQAIRATYFKDIIDYVQGLNTANDSDLVVTAELAKIENIHEECTLASAEGSITAALSPAAASAAPGTASMTSTSITVSTTSAAGATQADTFTLSGKSPQVGNIPDVTVAIANGETADNILDGILSAIQSQLSSKAEPDITATKSGGAVIIQAPTVDDISWTTTLESGNKSGVVVVQAVVPNTAAKQPGQQAPPGQQPQAGQPGQPSRQGKSGQSAKPSPPNK